MIYTAIWIIFISAIVCGYFIGTCLEGIIHPKERQGSNIWL